MSTYPIKSQPSIAVGQSASVPFTPDHAGLVKLIVDTGASNVVVLGKTPRPNEVREDTVDGTASAITLFHADGEIDLGDGVTRHVPVDRSDSFPTLEGLMQSLGGDVAGLLGLTSLGRERIILGESAMTLVLPPVAPNPD